MIDYLAICVVSFFYVGAKAFQQLNVVFKKYWAVPVMSYVMAACEVFIVVGIVKNQDWWTVLALGTGATLGCMLSMLLHERVTGTGYGRKRVEKPWDNRGDIPRDKIVRAVRAVARRDK